MALHPADFNLGDPYLDPMGQANTMFSQGGFSPQQQALNNLLSQTGFQQFGTRLKGKDKKLERTALRNIQQQSLLGSRMMGTSPYQMFGGF